MARERADDDARHYYPALRTFGFTKREADVARLLSWNHTDGEIGDLLGISASTVQKHIVKIRGKLKAEDRRVAGARIRVILRKWRRDNGFSPTTH